MKFSYKGRDKDNNLVSGIIEGKSRKDAIVQLKKKKITIIDLKEEKNTPTQILKRKLSNRLDKIKNSKRFSSISKLNKLKNMNLSLNININQIEVDTSSKKSNSKNKKNKINPKTFKKIQQKALEQSLLDIDIEEMSNPDYFKKIDKEIRKQEKKSKKNKNVLTTDISMDSIKKFLNTDLKSLKQNKKKKLGRRKVKKKEIMMFSKQFVVLLEAGIPLVKCLQILMQQTKNSYFQRVLAYLAKEVSQGSTLSNALSKFPHVFDEYYISMVKTGEATGELSHTFEMLYRNMLSNQKLKSKIIEASIYPIFIFTILIFAMLAAVFIIIPQFEELFAGQPLPDFTRIYFGIIKFIGRNIIYIIGSFIGFIITFKLALKNVYFKYFVDLQKFKIPVLGNVIKEYQNTIMLKTLNISLSSGISLTESIAIAINNTTNYGMKFELQNVLNAVVQGVPLSVAMQSSSVFPNYTVNMIKIGEESGKLQEMIENTYEWYDWKISTFIDKASKWMEPASILLVAIFVAPMIFAIALPMFEISSGAGIQ